MAGVHLSWTHFLLRLSCAVICGIAIGAERQWRQRIAGLRTYSLVCLGAALFVLLGPFAGEETDIIKLAPQVISGIGFIGAGVLMRTGLSVHGLNTASTIWCSAAIGVLSGAGFYSGALLGTIIVLAINIFLRPLADWLSKRSKEPPDHEIGYTIQLTCRDRQEARVRTLLIQLLTNSPLSLHELDSNVSSDDNRTVITATLSALERIDSQVEQIASRMSMEVAVVGISWKVTTLT
jgi:putative Mg2+ transporter-C (MgtC) family protein